MPNPSLCTDRNLADTRGCFDVVTTELWDSSSSVCHERVSADDPPTTQLRPHNRHTGQSPVASHPRAHSVQGHSPCVQSASQTRATVSQTTDSCFQPTWSTCTPFGWHESTGQTVYSTVDCRAFDVVLEQSASSCALSRDSYHVQTETKNVYVCKII